jgi:hypothetical protein
MNFANLIQIAGGSNGDEFNGLDLPEQAQNFRPIFSQQIHCTAEPAQSAFNVFEPGRHAMFEAVYSQLDLIYVAAYCRNRGIEGPHRHHLATDRRYIVAQLLNGAGDKANQVVIRLGH